MSWKRWHWIKRTLETSEHIEFIHGVYAWLDRVFGIRGLVLSALLTVTSSVWALVEQLSAPLIFTVGLAVFALTLVILNQFRRQHPSTDVIGKRKQAQQEPQIHSTVADATELTTTLPKRETPSDVARKSYYLTEPHDNLAEAMREAKTRNMPVFLVIYDENHSSQSRLAYCLMWFLEWDSVKKLVRDYFVSAMVSSSHADVRKFIPADDLLELARRVVLTPTGDVLRNVPVYANPEVASREINEDIASWDKHVSGQ